MFGRRLASSPAPDATPTDPNELLRRIDRQTTQMFHWVRAGVVVIIVLLIISILIG